MNPYALPAIISIVPSAIFGLTLLLLNPRDRTTRLLGMLSLWFALLGATLAMFHLATTEEQATFRNRWPYAVILPGLQLIIEYGFECSGRSQRLRESLLGMSMSFHRWLAAALLAISWVAVLSTDWIIAPPVHNAVTGWEHGYGSGFPVFLLALTYVIVILFFVLWRGVKAARDTIERRFRQSCLLALAGGLIAAAPLGFIFPGVLGWPTHAFSALPLLCSFALLTYGQMRYQFETIDDFSRGLESKVAERTAELAQANLDLQEAKEVADEASRVKGAFLSTVSHELRTPLTSVLGFAKLIKKRLGDAVGPAVAPDDRKAQRALQQVNENAGIIVAEGERLTALINDVLDLAKIESGKVEWHMQPVAVGEIVQRAIAATNALSGAKGLVVHTEIDSSLSTVVGDPDRLIQVVINLLSNAIKFTDQGAITCGAHRVDGAIEVRVTDTGTGLAPEDQGKVFEQFVQVGDTLTGKPTGTGLGLPICEHHGGRIWVESAVGMGSTFAFTLPIERPAADNRSPIAPPVRRERG